MIETRLLKQFIAVAEELHYNKAAIRLHMAQPPLSQAINRLEEKLKFRLFIRNKRSVKLTVAGVAFLEVAYCILKDLASGIEHARNVSEGIAGKLVVTTISIAYYEPLLNSLKQFREAYPKVQLIIREMPSANQAKALMSGDADIAFMRKLLITTDIIKSKLILEEEIVIALPLGHPKASNTQIELKDFANEKFVFTPQILGAEYHHQLIALCEAAGFYPNVVQETEQIHTLIGLVACGFGVALVPASIAKSPLRDRVQFRHIRPVAKIPNPAIGLYLNWNVQNESPLRDKFMSMLNFST